MSEPVEIGTHRGIRFFEHCETPTALRAWMDEHPPDPHLFAVCVPWSELASFRIIGLLSGRPAKRVIMPVGYVRHAFRNDPEFIWKKDEPPPSDACTQCRGTGKTSSLLGSFADYTCTRCGGSKKEPASAQLFRKAVASLSEALDRELSRVNMYAE